MPWYWWGEKRDQSDPSTALNPELKKFLEEQQPRPYATPEPSKHVSDYQNATKPITPSTEVEPGPEEKPLPRESLFQDGRYAHLWKTYTPSSDVVSSGNTSNVSPVDRITNARKDRRTSIHRAALENCAFEEEIKQQCMTGRGAGSRLKGTMTMCSDETKQYNRCYQLQAKFLQALGYMSGPDVDADIEERIQMHADKLYHRMMDYEADVEDAKRNNKPVPPLTSIFNANRPAPTIEQMALPEAMQARLQTPLIDLPPHERELAARAALQEAKISTSNAQEFFKYTTSMNEDRKKRQAMISRIMGEPIAKFFVPDPEEAQAKFDESAQKLNFDRDIWRGDGSPTPTSRGETTQSKK